MLLRPRKHLIAYAARPSPATNGAGKGEPRSGGVLRMALAGDSSDRVIVRATDGASHSTTPSRRS